MRADEGVQLAVLGDEALRRDGHVGVEQLVAVGLDQPGQQGHAQLTGQIHQAPGAGPVRHRLGQGCNLLTRQLLEERVARDRALVEADDLGSLGGSPAGQGLDTAEVVVLVGVPGLELRGGNLDVAHQILPRG